MGRGLGVRMGRGIGVAAVLAAAGARAQGVPQPAPFFAGGAEQTRVPIDSALASDYFDPRFTAENLGLDALFAALEEPLDYQADAATFPELYEPLCSFHADLLLHGTQCRMDVGWYCADDPTSFSPLVTASSVVDYHDALTGDFAWYQNGDAAFVPLVGLPPLAGMPYTSTGSPGALGGCPSGRIGVTVRPASGAAGLIPSAEAQPCTEQKYSEARLNRLHAASGEPWVSALVYRSRRTPGAYYVAFEDLPTSDTSFNPGIEVGEERWMADGDFNDFVLRLEGLVCAGGVERCETGRLGRCSVGVTRCTADGVPAACDPVFTAAAESCNGIDDDCNGFADDGDGLCPTPNEVCSRGVCVAACTAGAAPCLPGETCDESTGRCVAEDCLDVACDRGQICRGGTCVDGCAGLTCPSGQSCMLGACVDLCAGVTCAASYVCDAGACVPDCHCRACPGLGECGDDGRCVDPTCVGITCDPGLVCDGGACVDPCANVICPGGMRCSGGECRSAGTGGAAGSGGNATGGIVILPYTGGTTSGGTSASSGGTGASSGGTGASSGGTGGDGGAGLAGEDGVPAPATGGAPSGGAGHSGGGGTSAAGGAADAGAAPVAGDTPTAPNLPARDDGGDGDGCGCRTAPGPRSATPWVLLAAGVAALARRRAARRRGWALLGALAVAGCGGGGDDEGDGDGSGGRAATGGAATGGGATAGGATEGGAAAGGAPASGGTNGGSGTGGAVIDLGCPPLPPPEGAVIEVTPDQARDLHTIVDEAPAGSTVVLAPGTYPLARWIRLSQPGVTLRSSTDRAADVILDAAYSDVAPEAVVITADDVTLAHITIQRAIDHPVHVYPPEGGPDVTGPRLYGVRLVDGGEQFLKVNPNGDASAFVDEGAVECSELVMTDEGRPHVETLDSGACYTGGIDVHAARGWVVRSSRFQGIYCTNGGLAEHAIHFWRGARDTVIENNVIVDCARGIGLGMGSGAAADVSTRTWPDAPYDGAPLGHVDGVVANNVIWAAIDQFDTGIEIQQARRVTVLHNTVVGEPGIAGFFSSIDYRFAGTDVVIQNNYTRRITSRDGAAGTVDHNVETESLAAFVDAPGGDFHLLETATEAIDQGVEHALSGVDLDGEPHANGPPDVGADER